MAAQILSALYPVLLAVYPILYLHVSNPGQTRPGELVLPVACSVLAVLLLYAGAVIVLRDAAKASLVATMVVLGFFGFGPAFWSLYFARALVRGGTAPTDTSTLEYFVVAAAACVVVFGVVLIRRLRPMTARALGTAAAVFTAALLVMLAGLWVFQGPRPAAPAELVANRNPVTAPAGAPDIYQIVLDGYGRADQLAIHFGLDNRPFLEALEREGFTVASRSRANYYWTFLSLASMLNMRYVTELQSDSRDRAVPIRMILSSEVARVLKARGYTTVHLDSTWSGTRSNPYADVDIPCEAGWFQSNFARAVAESTPLRLARATAAGDVASCHESQLEALPRVAGLPGPKFVFAHFIPPHHPYVFDREGRILRRAAIGDQFDFQSRLWARRDLYRDQLLYMNDRILEDVRAIVRQRPNAVVLLHSDHGPRLVNELGQTQAGDRDVRFANLVAVRSPGAPALMPDDVELVNVYRLLLNRYVGTSYEVLTGAQYYSPYEQPFAFLRVHAR